MDTFHETKPKIFFQLILPLSHETDHLCAWCPDNHGTSLSEKIYEKRNVVRLLSFFLVFSRNSDLTASKKFLVGGGGGLFDYSVYSWSLFNQKPGRLDQKGP